LNTSTYYYLCIKVIADHKEISKINGQLHTIIGSLKSECGKVLDKVKEAGDFSEIWQKDAEFKHQEFAEHNPSLSEYQEQIRYFHVSNYQSYTVLVIAFFEIKHF